MQKSATDRNVLEKLGLIVAEGFGLGYVPIMPGTLGSLWAFPVAKILMYVSLYYWLMSCVLLLIMAIVLSEVAIAYYGCSDPKSVVIDEYVPAAIMLSLLPDTMVFWLSAFFLFRLLDIVKPYPICLAERLPSGLGVVADDVCAAALAYLIVISLLGLQ